MVKSRTYIATPPGATIKEQLMDRGMSQKEFSARMDMSEKHISRLINGEVQLTTEMAVKLEYVLGIPAKFWTNLEAIYREKLVKAEAENSMDDDIELARLIPYSEMAKLGWVPETRKAAEKVIYLRKYFEVVSLGLLEDNQITRIACRRLAITEKSDLALMAWAQRAKLEARSCETAPINIKGLIEAIPEIRKMTLQNPEVFCDNLRQILSDCGIALVFIPHLKGSFLHGATFVDGTKIVLGMTVRGKDADKFWFSLFHELGHIILGHIGQHNAVNIEEENEADHYAKEALISEAMLSDYLHRNDVNEASISAFAAKLGIAPGIVVGRLQNEGVIKHNMFNSLKIQYDIM